MAEGGHIVDQWRLHLVLLILAVCRYQWFLPLGAFHVRSGAGMSSDTLRHSV